MRPLFVTSTFVAVAFALPALAQSTSPSPTTGSQAQSSQPAGTAGHNTMQLQQKLKQDLEQAGFQNVQIMPESFLVRAKNKDGQPVMMIVNPDSVTTVTSVGGSGTTGSSQTGSASGSASSGAGSHTTK